MTSDRYLKVILTVIAMELFWIGVRDIATPVSAQATVTPTPVIIRGVNINDLESRGTLPIDLAKTHPDRPVKIEADRPLRIEALRALKVEIDQPVKIEADRPLLVESVPYTPGARRPGEEE